MRMTRPFAIGVLAAFAPMMLVTSEAWAQG